MTEQPPSKDVTLADVMAYLRERHVEQIAAGNEWSYEGVAHAQIEHLRREIARITGEREPPHCSTCDCWAADSAQPPSPAQIQP